ncbi:YHYH domain-containing protein [Clostridium sp. CCUG 7971]|uniref:YHYH domain-containing protein n=1 Tax=Clostridium sp. CCUG 7971 TaxID=2811414 RepID=UPI0025709B6F|nr:YHYH domain-containing protein [Clostridium sp. CCUG 7971]
MRKNMKSKKLISLASAMFMISAISVDAHSGRTDSSGGHKDNKNKSGLGSYHYHCGGHPAHLHTNGCPYNGSSNNSSSSSSSNNSSKSSSSESSINSEEKIKQEVKTKAYNAGYEDGYKGNTQYIDYSGSYTDLYEEKYNEGFYIGEKKLNSEKELANKKGYDIGIKGENSESKLYENEVLQQSFVLGYSTGISEYKEKKSNEYTNLGLENGKKDIDNFDINTIEEEFREVYIENFNKGQEELSNHYKENGYKFAFTQEEYKSPNYDKEKYNNWYKEGYESGVENLKKLKDTAYNDGYDGSYKVPEGMGDVEDIYSKYNLKGKADAKKDSTEKLAVGAGVVVAGVFGFGYFKSKKKKEL